MTSNALSISVDDTSRVSSWSDTLALKSCTVCNLIDYPKCAILLYDRLLEKRIDSCGGHLFKALTFPKHSLVFLTTLGGFTVGRLIQGDMGPGYLYLVLTGALFALMAFLVKEESRHAFQMFQKMRENYFLLAQRIDEDILTDMLAWKLNGLDIVFHDDPQQLLQKHECRFTYRVDTSDTIHEGLLSFDGDDLYLSSPQRVVIIA